MTVWKKLENEECYAVAIYNYSPSKTEVPHLALEVGELVHIERECQEWYWGRSLRRAAKGAFPKCYVAVRECHVEKCGNTILASAGGVGVVHDIALTLREWLKLWKNLYINNDDRFKFMEVSMRALLELRAQAASGALPQDQLRRVARTATFTIDKGNRTLGMELAVRTTGGQLVDPLKTSMYKLNSLHEEANARIDKNMETTPSSPVPVAPPTARSYSVCVRIHNFVCRMSESAELLLALYDSQHNKLTEHLLLRWPPHNVSPAQVVFTDLGGDIKREKLFLVCHVIRIGSMEATNADYRLSTIRHDNNYPGRSSIAPLAVASPIAASVGVMRRPFGVACADITRHLQVDSSDKHILVPFYACEKEKMDTLLKQVITNQRDLKDAKHSQGVWVSLQLVEGDLKQIREENPHLVVGNTVVARKMGFPEVIMPGDARNDLYVTLVSGSFSKGGGKSSERNIELVARVVDRYGNPLPSVISVGAGVPLVEEYTSLVHYHEDKPRWQEVFKVCLNIETFKEAHLVFLCRHRSSNEAKDRAEKHFALAYLRLMQKEGTTTTDALHDLCVYKIDVKKSNSNDILKEAAAACLGLPSKRDELPTAAEKGLTRGVLSLIYKDSLTVATKLCSTKLTQREEILGVLKWGTHHAEGNLRAALQRLLHVPSEEIVKFLQDILDALFSILTQVEEEGECYSESSYGVLVLECLLHVISLVADHKYHHFQPVLHLYIDQSFCDAAAYEKLIAVMVWVMTSADGGETKRLLQCMKCLESLVRIIARSRQLRAALAPNDRASRTDFNHQFESLLNALVWLMRCGDHALTCQGCALKYLPHAVPHAIKVYPETELSQYIVAALEALPLNRLSKQRMLALLELVRGPLCADPAARATILPHTAMTINALLKDKAEWDRDAAHKSRSVDKAARLLGANTDRLHDHTVHTHQIVELCVETLGEIVALLARDDVGPVEADRGDLAKRLLPTVLKTAASMLVDRKRTENDGYVDDPMLRRIVCVLLDMVRQMSLEQYSMVVAGLEAEQADGVGSLVGSALALLLALLARPVFRPHWADMHHTQLYVMTHAVRLLARTLRERVHSADEADTEAVAGVHQLLQEWFRAATVLSTAPALQLETLPVARKQRIVALFGDLRHTLASSLQEMWFGLDEHKRAFIPCLVGPFLEVSFLREEEVRNTTIPLFFDMMQTEFNSTSVDGGEGSLKELESELIDKIDVLVEGGAGDFKWRARFVTLCGALCNASAPPFRPCALALVAAAARQLDTLLQYRTAALRSATPHRMHLTNRVLNFYEQIERPHMYIRYVHKLAKMHHDAGQWAEAGLALRLHAKLLVWSRDPLPPRLRHPAPTHAHAHHTHRELKEFLYHEIAELLNRGHQWELGVEAVKELVSVYEDELVGYAQLAELHTRLARLYECMLRTPRAPPEYYRVRYHGGGFPSHLTTEHGFIYRGNEYEQLGEFKERLLDEWPDAEVLTKLDQPGEEITKSDGQYLQINPVKPIMGDKLKRLSGKPVAEQILEYYKYNNVDKFVFNRPYHRPEELEDGEEISATNEFATRWLERTELAISETLPGILRWFPVISVRTYWVSPIEAAVEALQDNNRSIRKLTLAAKAPEASLHPLTMKLKGVLDAAVQGGIVNYEKAFLTVAYEAKHPDHAGHIARLKEAIIDQIPVLKFGLEVHGERVAPAVQDLHHHLLACFREMQHHVHQKYGKKMCDFEPDTPDVQLRTPLRGSPQPDTCNRMSDISTGNDSASKLKFFSFNNAINPLASNFSNFRNSSSAMANFGFSTMTSPKRRDNKRRNGRKSEVGTQASGSQWYTTSTPNGNVVNNSVSNNNSSFNNVSNNNTSQFETPTASPLRVLNQEKAVTKSAYLNDPLDALNNAKAVTKSAYLNDPLDALNNALVTERPLRSEVERERRLSHRASILTSASSAPPSNRDSMGTTDSNQDEEEPPPLPQKSSHRSIEVLDTDNNNDSNPLPPRNNYDTVWSPRGSFLYNSIAQRRHTAAVDKPPTPPPKKKHNNA